MRSIFWRILGAFWLALLLTGVLTYLVTSFFNKDSWVLSQHPGFQKLSAKWLELYSDGKSEQAQQLLQEVRRRYHISVQVFDEEGQLLASNSRMRNNAERLGDLQGPAGSSWRRLTQEVSLTANHGLLFVYRVPLIELRKWQASRVSGPGAMLIVAVLVITMVSLLLTLSFTRPLMRLRNAVHELGETAYQQSSLARMAKRNDELGLLAADFNRMGQRLQGMLNSQKQLLRDVSHELRSPLARLQVGLALAERANEEKRQELWPKLTLECQRLDGLIDEILTLARVTQEPLNLEHIHLLPFLRSLQEDAGLLAPEQTVQLNCPDSLSWQTDTRLLHRALDNLLRNALRFNPKNEIVQLEAGMQPDGSILLKVRDHGPGAPDELLEQLVEPFVRANGQTTNGHGLGLTITLRCVEQLGGTLRLQNHPAGGFVASILLPAG